MPEKPTKRLRSSRSALFKVGVVCVGALIGVGAFTAVYADAASYLGSDPKTCTNCHVMNEQYDGWKSGTHANAATCNDCHLPHDSLISKYLVKAEDGFLHSYKFTTGDYPEHIQIREKNLKVTNNACLHCHGDLTDELQISAHANNEGQVSCVRCHAGVGH